MTLKRKKINHTGNGYTVFSLIIEKKTKNMKSRRKNKKRNKMKMNLILLIQISKAINKNKIISLQMKTNKLVKLHLNHHLKKLARIQNWKKDILNKMKMKKILELSQRKDKELKIIEQKKTF